MADSDLSRIVNLIMENPALIEEIKGLASGGAGSEKAEEQKDPPAPIEEREDAQIEADLPKVRRRELLCALKPYVSEKRSRAIDSMLTIVEILDVMRSK